MTNGDVETDQDVGVGGQTATPTTTDSGAPKTVESDTDVGVAKAAPQTGTWTDVGKSALSGVAQGVVTAPGIFGDIQQGANWALGKEGELGEYVARKIGVPEERIAAARKWRQAESLPQTTPTSSDLLSGAAKIAPGIAYKPQTTPGRYTQTISQFVPQVAAGDAPLVMEKGVTAAVPTIAKHLLTQGVIPAAASETAGHAVEGTWAEPWVRGGTAFVTGAGTHLATEGLGELKTLAARPEDVSGASIPAAKPWAIDRAAQTFRGMATDPVAAQAELSRAIAARTDPNQPVGATIPDFAPKTGELTGDPGLLSQTRAAVTKDPKVNFDNQFGTGLEQQNAAISKAIQNLQPTGDPSDVAAALKAGRDALDNQHTNAVNVSLAQARRAAPAATGVPTPEAQGAALRTPAADRRQAEVDKRNELYAAVDPNGTLTLPSGPIGQSVKDISGQISTTARPMAGEESEIFKAAAALPPNAPFKDVQSLASRVGDQMQAERAANGGTPNTAYARLAQLRTSIEGVIDNGARQVADSERGAVAAGTLAPDQTVAARIRNWWGRNYPDLGVTAPTGAPVGAGGPQIAGPPTVTASDPAAASRLAAARAQHGYIKGTFDEGPVGQILAKGPGGAYDTPASQVPGTIFKSGPTGYETAKAYADAAGAGHLNPLVDTAVESLRNEAMTADGTIDPQKFASWQARYANALRALPADVRSQFSTAASASDAYEGAVAARKQALDTYQKGAVGKLLGVSSPDDVTKIINGMAGARDGVQQITDLMARTAGDQNAQEGVRRALAEDIIRRSTSPTEMGTSGVNKVNGAKYLQAIQDSSAKLKAAGFTAEQLDQMEKIGGAIQQSQRTLQATRLPGGSNTAQDTINAFKEGGQQEHSTALTKILGIAEAAKIAREFVSAGTAGIGGAILGAGALGMKGVNALRGAGIRDSNTLIHDAMLNPELANALLQRSSLLKDRGSEIPLRRALVKSALYGTLQAARPGTGQ
jgi:hypothetical protein